MSDVIACCAADAAGHDAGIPQVSVVILTFDRPAALRRCLASLAAQSFPASAFEVVLVDVSTTPVQAVVADFAGSLSIVHVVGPNAGVAANRNTGAAHARGDVLAFLDDDCRADRDWLARLAKAVAAAPRVLAAAAVAHEAPATAVAAAGQVITEGVDAFFNPPHAAPRFLPGLNFALDRRAYLALGGCDATYGQLAAEDREFIDRWRATGGTLMLCRDIVVHHDHRSTLRGFVRQYFNYGRGAWRFHRQRRARGSGRMRDDLQLHVGLPAYLRAPVARLPWSVRFAVLGLLAVWQAANAAGFLWQAVADATGAPADGLPSATSA